MAGREGRPALPSKVVQLRGNPSKKPMAALLDEFSPESSLAKLPTWVKGEARKEYGRIGEELARYQIVSEIDRGGLIMMACEWARYVWAEQRIAQLNAEDEHGERGLVDRTPNDYRVVSVYEQIRRESMRSYQKWAGEFGLTPASRSRVRPGSPQLPLPGIESEPAQDRGPSLRNFA